MSKLSKTWWGDKFIQALARFLDEGRLQRGRAYRTDSRIRSFRIEANRITAKVRGNVNPYFGVYTEPLYEVKIEITPVAPKKWTTIIRRISGNAAWVSQLLLSEMPAGIENAFAGSAVSFLPDRARDFKTNCSCPDYANPCKHIAGVYYRVAALLEEDPFLMFQLRGLTREKLLAELAKSPLGQALSAGLTTTEHSKPVPAAHCYPQPELLEIPAGLRPEAFWSGSRHLPESLPDTRKPPAVSAILVKKQGDYPPFWKADNSFIAVMEDIYDQVKKKNSGSL